MQNNIGTIENRKGGRTLWGYDVMFIYTSKVPKAHFPYNKTTLRDTMMDDHPLLKRTQHLAKGMLRDLVEELDGLTSLEILEVTDMLLTYLTKGLRALANTASDAGRHRNGN